MAITNLRPSYSRRHVATAIGKAMEKWEKWGGARIEEPRLYW